MRKIIAVAALLLLGACSAISGLSTASLSQDTINKARTAVLGIDNLYGIAVITADTWAKQPRCGSPGAPPAPVCSTAVGVIALNKLAITTRGSLNQAEALVMKASPQQSDLDLAIATAQSAWTAYQNGLAVYGIPTK